MLSILTVLPICHCCIAADTPLLLFWSRLTAYKFSAFLAPRPERQGSHVQHNLAAVRGFVPQKLNRAVKASRGMSKSTVSRWRLVLTILVF